MVTTNRAYAQSQALVQTTAFISVGSANQTAYLLQGSETLKFNTFDFSLIDPLITPLLGDEVELTTPVWYGIVVSVQVADAGISGHRIVTIAATNSNTAFATAAPIALTDSPSNYSNLVIKKATTDTGLQTTGTVTTFVTGLWPAMTFALTSANQGLVAANYTVQDVSITWAKQIPRYDITFGDPIVLLSDWVASQAVAAIGGTFPITTTEITDGAVSTPKLAANSVDATKIAANTITASQIAGGTITSTEIANGTITGTDIAGTTITGSNIVTGTITTTQIAANTITASDIQAGTITATELAAGSVTATKLAAGAVTVLDNGNGVSITTGGIEVDGNLSTITFKDKYGNTSLSAGGFGGTWQDFIADGIYDSTFKFATAGTIANGLNNALPNWTVSRGSLTSLTAIADTTWPGGIYVEAIPSGINGQVTFISDIVPVQPLQTINPLMWVAGVCAGGSVVTLTATIQFYKADGVTTVSSAAESIGNFSTTQSTPVALSGGPVTVPANARFATLQLEAQELSAHSGSTRMRIGGGALRLFGEMGYQPYVFIAETNFWLPWATTTSISANQTNIYPLKLDAPMQLLACTVVNTDTTLTRSFEWQLYFDPGGAVSTAQAVVGAHGTFSWTAAAKSAQTSTCDIQFLVLAPGSYWLAIHNSQGTNALTLVAEAQHTGITPTYSAAGGVKAAAGATGSTFDFSTLTGFGATIPAVWLSGTTLQTNWG